MSQGAWMQTRAGHAWDLLDPDPSLVSVYELARVLASINRYNGHAGRYSVAEHCLTVADWVETQTTNRGVILAAVLHDAHEVYVGDMTYPMQMAMEALAPGTVRAAINDLKARTDRAILAALDVGHIDLAHPLVRRADAGVLLDERDALWRGPPPRAWDVPESMRLGVTPVRFASEYEAAEAWYFRVNALLRFIKGGG